MGHSMGGIALMKFTEKYSDMQSAINRIIIIDTFCSAAATSIDRSDNGKMLEEMLKIEMNQPLENIYREI
jgi:uncharacterized alpha/beta hydrolase family protein